jgi:large subunit ribosomal protein L28
MPRVCFFTGARTTTGRTIHYRGRPKHQGGIGLKPSGIARRKFKPNIQTVRAVIDGKPTRVKATAKSIRNGLVVKPLRRKYGWTRKQKELQAQGA